MNLIKRSLQDELDSFFKHLWNLPLERRTVTKAALCKARRKLSHTTFIELNNHLVNSFYQQTDFTRWKGFRLNAVDGSTLKLPNNVSTVEHFGRQTGKEVPQSRLSSRYDVLNGVTLELLVRPIHADERKMAHDHLKNVTSADLIIYDRGYPCFSLFSAHRDIRANFLMRLPSKFSKETIAFEKSNLTEEIITIAPGRPETKKRCVDAGASTEPVTLRLVKIPLSEDETEILATSLINQEAYPYEDFKSLYALRWAIEEDYKTKKVWLEFENFSGKSVESIYQDVYAKLFVQNIAALISWSAIPLVKEKYRNRKYEYQINKCQALSKMKNCLVKMVTENTACIINSLIEIFVQTVEPIRPNRSFQRNKKFRQRHFYSQYKTVR